MKKLPWIIILLLIASNIYFIVKYCKGTGDEHDLAEQKITIEEAEALIARYDTSAIVGWVEEKQNFFLSKAVSRTINRSYNGIFVKRGMKPDGSLVDLAFGNTNDTVQTPKEAYILKASSCRCKPCCYPPNPNPVPGPGPSPSESGTPGK